MKKIYFVTILLISLFMNAQGVLTPEKLWQLGRVSAIGITKDQKNIIFKVGIPNIEQNKIQSKYYSISISGGNATEIVSPEGLVNDKNISPDGKYKLSFKETKVEKILGVDFYPNLTKSNVQIYNGLDYRHWDTWNDGTHNHVGYEEIGKPETFIDIMKDEAFNAPQKPFGGDEDFIWSPDGSKIIYVCKKKSGTAYAISTDTDIYEYDLKTKQTKNLIEWQDFNVEKSSTGEKSTTKKNSGYDTNPQFSPQGYLTWLQMKRDGYEADKNDIIVSFKGIKLNLTANWDGTVESFMWNKDGKKIFFIAPVKGTKQLFEIKFDDMTKSSGIKTQLTDGDFDVASIVDVLNDKIIVARTDHNHATEIYTYQFSSKTWTQLTHVNDAFYATIDKCVSEKRWVNTTDGKKMLVWVILPPNFDKSKKYPTLLFCQGGPQSALTQSYSFRWNFQLMASQGYIVVAPNRRGMPGHGVEWNEKISGDWGGQVMQDYLSAIDEISKEPYVDKKRLGAVGASYGGYSVFQLAGIHKNRFKTFISHCGIYNTESFYGTTEEVFFSNFDFKGAYWEKENALAQKVYNEFNPSKAINNWNTPILIIQGGKDYRVPIGQGQEAFQATQLKGIKSRFLFLPEENHWVLKPQNALVWQGEFYKWLEETL